MRSWGYFSVSFVIVALVAACFVPSADAALALKDRVTEAFQSVYKRAPSSTEKAAWVARVVKGDKKTYQELVGAMSYQKANTGKPAATAKTAATNKTQLIKDVLPLFIKIFGNNPTEAEKAWWRKRISCDEVKNTDALIKSMNFHKSKKVRKGSDAICGATAGASNGSAGGVSKKQVAGIGTHIMGDEVRIGIFQTNGSVIKITADGSFQIREGKNKKLATRGKDDEVQVSWSGGKYHIRGSDLKIDTEEEVRFIPENQAIMKIVNYSDPSKTYPGKNYNRFRGVIEVRKCTDCNELWAINEIRVEYYLRGLGETSGEGPEEYIKALGIAARTYVLYHKVVTDSRFPKKGFVITNTPNDQIYRGYEYEIITPRMSSIFNTVKGIVATDSEGDNLITTVYFSDSDGRTRSAKEVWNSSRFPYLQSVEDPYHNSKSCLGHCVGMSAQGAYGFAKKDEWSFSKILNYYYKGIKLIKAY